MDLDGNIDMEQVNDSYMNVTFLNEEDKFLLKIARLIYDKEIKNECTQLDSGHKFLYKHIHSFHVLHLPKTKYQFANFHIRIYYYEKFRYIRRSKYKGYEQVYEKDNAKPYIDYPILSIIKRGVIEKGIRDVGYAMRNTFRSNVLIVKDFRFADYERHIIKLLFSGDGIVLFYEDELN